MNSRITAVLIALLGLALLGAFPKKTSYDSAWSRTAMTVPGPRGKGCIVYRPTSGASFVLEENGTNTDAVFELPLQVVITNTATSTFILCAHQTAAPTINALGYFSSGAAHPAGPGICRFIAAGATDYFGVASDAFSGTTGSGTAGNPVGYAANFAGRTYLSGMNPGGSSEGAAIICEVE